MSLTNDFAGVSNFYVFKSRLQEYAQKEKLSTPVYETLMEGPSCFRSTVIVNDVKYNSLVGFCNRKVAEQSAAEIALMELAKLGNSRGSVIHPVEYALKMNFAVPAYVCHPLEAAGTQMFTSNINIGGIQYIGTAAKTKKGAEIKAARTALLAIQSSRCGFETPSDGNPQFTVLPSNKKTSESKNAQEEAKKALKRKKNSLRKKQLKWKARQNNGYQVKDDPTGEVIGNDLENHLESHEQDHLQVHVQEVIGSSPSSGNPQLAALPSEKKTSESKSAQEEAKKALKRKKTSLRKKQKKRKVHLNNGDQAKDNPAGEVIGNDSEKHMESHAQDQLQVHVHEVIDSSPSGGNPLLTALPSKQKTSES